MKNNDLMGPLYLRGLYLAHAVSCFAILRGLHVPNKGFKTALVLLLGNKML